MEDTKKLEDFILTDDTEIKSEIETYSYEFSSSVRINITYKLDINKSYRRGSFNPDVVIVESNKNKILSIPMSAVCPGSTCTGGSIEKKIENLLSTQSIGITYRVSKLDDYGLYINWRPIIKVYADGNEVLNQDFKVGNTNAKLETRALKINIRKT